MTLIHILAFSAFALLVGWLVPFRWRGWILFTSSVLAVYWLQPSTPVRNLDFWFPTASIALTVIVWAATRSGDRGSLRTNATAFLGIAALILAVALTRYLEPVCCLTPTRPPGILLVLLALAITGGLVFLILRLLPSGRFLPAVLILVIVILFIIQKSEALGQTASAGLRFLSGQTPGLASFLDLRWLGFSYLAFRLIHVLRDYQTGKLPSYSLSNFITYALFFPAYTAGPIDRSQHFISDLFKLQMVPAGSGERPQPEPVRITARASDYFPALSAGGYRILWGTFKKFVLADSLALFALNGLNAEQTTSTLWMWVLVYAYTLRIYFDFSGYTDIALGLGSLVGITLPENFTAPYLKTNLSAFWNSWHITLALWFRAYSFNPLTRALRTARVKLPVWGVILTGQVLTMLLIGLWHGISWNFAAWGVWHGLGLFVHNRWSDWVRSRGLPSINRPGFDRAARIGGWLLTFHYVALSWVWFALPTPELAVNVFRRLAGI